MRLSACKGQAQRCGHGGWAAGEEKAASEEEEVETAGLWSRTRAREPGYGEGERGVWGAQGEGLT